VLQNTIFGNILKNIVIEKSVYYKIDFPDFGSSATPSPESHPLRQTPEKRRFLVTRYTVGVPGIPTLTLGV
jgi:hypothetical protein